MKGPLTTLRDLAAHLAGARTAVQALHDADQELRRDHAALAAERQRLLGALPPAGDLVRTLTAEVDSLAVRWRTDHALELARAVAGHLHVDPHGVVRDVVPGSLLAAVPSLDVTALCGLLPDSTKTGLVETLRSATYDAAPPLRERAELIAAIDAKIAAIEEQHAHICDGLMPAENARRIRAQQHREAVDSYNHANSTAIKAGRVQAMR